MMLIQTHQLDEHQLNALDALCETCKKVDGNIVSIYRHLIDKYRSRPANLLCYQEQLVGFLGAFFFLEKTCELAIMVSPEFRRKGLASQLIRTIAPLFKDESVETIVFSAPHGLNDDWFSKIGLRYQNSEYQMQRAHLQPIATANHTKTIRAANQGDTNVLCAIDSACFPNQRANTPSRFQELLNDPNQSLFLIEQDHIPIGKAHINWLEKGARITDVAILPKEQGRGLGYALLAHCINHSLAVNKPIIRLDVETKNKSALGLYTRLGFEISNATDYWYIDELNLTDFLQHI